MLTGFCDCRAIFFAAAQEMKCISENYVTEQIVLWTIADVECRIELEIACDVAGETDRR